MEVAFGVGSLVLLAGGVTAAVRRSIQPGQALAVLGLAIAVGAIAVFAGWLGDRMGGLYQFFVVLPTTLAGMAMAVFLLTAPPRRIP